MSGLATFWDLADTTPKKEWKKWWDIFMVAAIANYSIQVLRTEKEQQKDSSTHKQLKRRSSGEIDSECPLSVIGICREKKPDE